MSLASCGKQVPPEVIADHSVSGINMLGVTIHTLTLTDFLDTITRAVLTGRRLLVNHVNTHALNLACQDPPFRQLLSRADITFCDGVGVQWGARLLRLRIPERYTAPDWISDLARICVAQGFTLYFLGARPGVAAKAMTRLCREFPALQVVGCHHGYFDKSPGHPENEAVIRAINMAQPNILIVGFGMPMQEEWLARNWTGVDANVAITAGALFDFVSGESKRAPTWMTKNGLEWLGRLGAEPGRLWKRYLLGNPLFLWRVLKQRFGKEPCL